MKPEKGRFLLLIVIGVVLGLLAIFMFTLVAILLSIRRKEHRVVSAKKAHANSSYDTKYTKVAIADANDVSSFYSRQVFQLEREIFVLTFFLQF